MVSIYTNFDNNPKHFTGYVLVIAHPAKVHLQHEQNYDKSPVACGKSSENDVDAQAM